MVPDEVRPRHHAMNMVLLDSIEDRRAYLNDKVPDKFKDWVMTYVKQWWPKRDELRRKYGRPHTSG